MTDKNDAFIEIKVKTNQPEFKVRCAGDMIAVDLKSNPIKNQANIEIIKMFTKILKKPVHIVSGGKSKVKVLKIEAMTKKDALDALTAVKN